MPRMTSKQVECASGKVSDKVCEATCKILDLDLENDEDQSMMLQMCLPLRSGG